ncbi:MAG: HypC/HybG/HupF family hydrogenase formation chaperone [Planctomycetota bacterium]|jgi:hydrogenase expression/formation protein HypC
MCLALPAKIVEREGEACWVVLGDTRMRVSLIMTPEAGVGSWVLVHAGFAIQRVSEEDALETWELIESVEKSAERRPRAEVMT